MGVTDYLILFLLLATVAVLIGGVVQLFRGGNPRRSNQLMVARVVLQALVIMLAALFLAR